MSDRSITEAILKLTGLNKVDQLYYVTCSVDSVDLSTRTCDCTIIDGNVNAKLPGVFLMAEVDDGVLIEPVIDSTVRVIFSKNVAPFIVQFSEIANITLISTDKIKLNGSEMGGLVQVIELTKKLNSLEKDINKIKAAFTSWVPVPSDGGAALKTAVSAWAGAQLAVTERKEIENETVVHGQ